MAKAVKSHNFAPAMFLLEVITQCDLALFAFEQLKKAAIGWCSNASSEASDHRGSPVEIFTYCGAFFSAATALVKILVYTSKAEKPKARRQTLRQLLEIEELPNLKKQLDVRNSFEHIDERLDRWLSNSSIQTLEPMRVSDSEPEPSTFVLKSFDPKKLAVSFAKDVIELQPCVDEITLVQSRINPALKKLYGARVPLWPEE